MAWGLDSLFGGASATAPALAQEGAASTNGSSTASGPCSLYRLEPAVDYIGGDLGADPLPALDQDACCAACEQSRLCNAFTFVAASRDCWLKLRRRQPRTLDQPTTLVSGHRGQLKLFRRPLGTAGAADSSHAAFPLARPIQNHMGGGGGLATRTQVFGGSRRVGGAFYGGASWRASGISAEAIRAQNERLTEYLLSSAAGAWRGVARGADGVPTLRLSLTPLPLPPPAHELRAAAADGGPLWLHWPARGAASSEVWRFGGARVPDVAWTTARAIPAADRTATDGAGGGGVAAEPQAQVQADAAADAAVVADAATATASSSDGTLGVAAAAPAPQHRTVMDRAMLTSVAVSDSASPQRSQALARLTAVWPDGHVMRYRPTRLPNAPALVGAGGGAGSAPLRFLVSGGLSSGAMRHALIAEAGGYGYALLLSTSAPCAHATEAPTPAIGDAESAGERCRRALSPLLSVAAMMPAAGALEASEARGCGAMWARQWWPGGEATIPATAAAAAAASIAGSASVAAARFGCDPVTSRPRPLWYAFSRKRILFLATSGANPFAAGYEQHTALGRAARAARVAGVSFVVAYGERPVAASSAEQLQKAMTSLGVDLFIYAPSAAAPDGAAAAEPDPKPEVVSVHAPTNGKKGAAILGLGAGVYARVRPLNRSALLVEPVRASDGRVVKAFSVPAAGHATAGHAAGSSAARKLPGESWNRGAKRGK